MTVSKPQNAMERGCPAVEQPLVTFVRLVREKVTVCGQLEDIADKLPDQIDLRQCAQLSERLPHLLKVCDGIYEEVVFPLLLQHQSQSYFSHTTAERLIGERLMDQGYALEVSELLHQLANAQPVPNADACGYLLRGFFEAVRRSSAFDLEYIVPMVQRHLTGRELEALRNMLSQHRFVLDQPCLATRRVLMNHTLH